MNAIRTAVVDDYEVVRRGLRDLFESEPDVTIVAEAATYAEALEQIPSADADVAIVDVRLGTDDGMDLCADLAGSAPATRCVVLTAYPDDEALVRAYDAGAAAFLVKDADGGTLLAAVRDVAAGHSLLGDDDVEPARRRAMSMPYDPILTDRERGVVAQLADGLTNREIAEHLGLSEKTVKNYVSNVLGKLGMTRRSEIAVYGVRAAARAEERVPPSR